MEIEVKFYLRHLEVIRKRLIAHGVRLKTDRLLEHNLRFDTPGQELASKKHVLRLRQDSRATLTFKRPLGQVETREEFEVEIDDFESGRKILEALGYTVTAIYEKYRETYQIDSVQVMLDELPFGCFVEIEGPSIESIRQLSDQLGLPWERRVQASYLELFDRIRRPLNLEFEEVTFEKLEGLAPVDPELLGVLQVD
ncbi:MAG: class IV adenylate cyclase [Anaerolineales bacterium]|nr:MAG: class IV adenylate cyclase [Anaerolineales bacterium]